LITIPSVKSLKYYLGSDTLDLNNEVEADVYSDSGYLSGHESLSDEFEAPKGSEIIDVETSACRRKSRLEVLELQVRSRMRVRRRICQTQPSLRIRSQKPFSSQNRTHLLLQSMYFLTWRTRMHLRLDGRLMSGSWHNSSMVVSCQAILKAKEWIHYWKCCQSCFETLHCELELKAHHKST
jgi:hypothetical protein